MSTKNRRFSTLAKEDGRLSYEALQAMPKIDLHRHLEGSLRLDTLSEIALEHGLDLPARDIESLRPYVQVMDEAPNFHSFLAKFQVLRRFYRSPEAVARLTYEAIADAAADNVHYLELRFSPQALAQTRRFALDEVTDWVIEATQRASRDLPIQVGLIVTLLRHEAISLAQKVAGIAFDRRDRGIVGLDVAGDEVNFSSEPFQEIFRIAKTLQMGVTVHAGEWQGAAAVHTAVDKLHADRLGHGVRTVENFEILQLVRERNIALEICLTSNLQTGVVRSLSHHPLLDFLDLNMNVTLNTDDPSVSDSMLTDEYRVAVQALGVTYVDLRQMILNAAAAAFLPAAERQRLVDHFTALLPVNDLPG